MPAVPATWLKSKSNLRPSGVPRLLSLQRKEEEMRTTQRVKSESLAKYHIKKTDCLIIHIICETTVRILRVCMLYLNFTCVCMFLNL